MSLPNRFAIQSRCDQIEQLVNGRDLDFLHAHGGVRVSVLGGPKAEAEGDFSDALNAYLTAKRSSLSDAASAQDQAALINAVDDWAAKMGY